MADNDFDDISDEDVRHSITYALRRFLRKQRDPDSAGFGARKIMAQLRMSGVVWRKKRTDWRHFQPYNDIDEE